MPRQTPRPVHFWCPQVHHRESLRAPATKRDEMPPTVRSPTAKHGQTSASDIGHGDFSAAIGFLPARDWHNA